MRSRYVEKFNHDADAPGYDLDVLNESDPVRAGYLAVLDWVAGKANCGPDCRVLDLGAGTGNLVPRLGSFRDLTCVDVSTKMIDIGRKKLGSRSDVSWIEKDILEFVCDSPPCFDVVVSTYAVHHLTDGEKKVLFGRIWNALSPGGRAVFGDLMFEDAAAREAVLEGYRNDERENLAEDLEDEFLWDIEAAAEELERLGFHLETKRFSELSWGILAEKPL